MTDLEISKQLALAIGWPKVSEYCLTVQVAEYGPWYTFDYRDWNVIGPIAARYDAFPKRSVLGYWTSYTDAAGYVTADTPQKSIALAVIQGAMK